MHCVCLPTVFVRSFKEVFATAVLTFPQQFLSIMIFQIITQVNRSKPARNMNFMSVFEIWAGRYDELHITTFLEH